jgi:hypothetical protein
MEKRDLNELFEGTFLEGLRDFEIDLPEPQERMEPRDRVIGKADELEQLLWHYSVSLMKYSRTLSVTAAFDLTGDAKNAAIIRSAVIGSQSEAVNSIFWAMVKSRLPGEAFGMDLGVREGFVLVAKPPSNRPDIQPIKLSDLTKMIRGDKDESEDN